MMLLGVIQISADARVGGGGAQSVKNIGETYKMYCYTTLYSLNLRSGFRPAFLDNGLKPPKSRRLFHTYYLFHAV